LRKFDTLESEILDRPTLEGETFVSDCDTKRKKPRRPDKRQFVEGEILRVRLFDSQNEVTVVQSKIVRILSDRSVSLTVLLVEMNGELYTFRFVYGTYIINKYLQRRNSRRNAFRMADRLPIGMCDPVQTVHDIKGEVLALLFRYVPGIDLIQMQNALMVESFHDECESPESVAHTLEERDPEKDKITEKRRRSGELAIDVCEELLPILEDMESVGVVHGDIKRANVVLDYEEQREPTSHSVVASFWEKLLLGMQAKRIYTFQPSIQCNASLIDSDSVVATGFFSTSLGYVTPVYAAPEMADEGGYKPGYDMFSFCVVLVHILDLGALFGDLFEQSLWTAGNLREKAESFIRDRGVELDRIVKDKEVFERMLGTLFEYPENMRQQIFRIFRIIMHGLVKDPKKRITPRRALAMYEENIEATFL
jgi:serine/threonine protein kinase